MDAILCVEAINRYEWFVQNVSEDERYYYGDGYLISSSKSDSDIAKGVYFHNSSASFVKTHVANIFILRNK